MLTDSQRKVYNFVRHFIEKHGYAPKLPEIAQGIGIKSKGVVHRYVQALVEEGLIEYEPHRHRGMRLVAANQSIPLLGKIAAGKPIEAIEHQQALELEGLFSGNNLYALKVQGDSMLEMGILDGDMVICEQRVTANDGEIVVALIDQQEATLKKIKRNNKEGTITLIPYNSAFQPITYHAERVTIQGVFRGLIRQ